MGRIDFDKLFVENNLVGGLGIKNLDFLAILDLVWLRRGQARQDHRYCKFFSIFEKIVSLKAELDKPILDCGADSLVIVEFVDHIEKKYQQDFEVEDNTTLRDMARQIEQS